MRMLLLLRFFAFLVYLTTRRSSSFQIGNSLNRLHCAAKMKTRSRTSYCLLGRSSLFSGRSLLTVPVEGCRSLGLLFLSLSDPEFFGLEEEEADNYPPKVPAASPEPFESELDVAIAANALLLEQQQEGITTATKKIELQNEVQNSFLQYALSIILGRALPDSRDGLKPVHRRILYSMYQLNLQPTSSHRKCARVVGEVLGKYHPHGDMAVYDALVRMAQDFTTNYRLVDGHGNFGSVDADPAAAMRYTECKLTQLSVQALLTELTDDTVDFIPNFDGNEVEPVVLPAKVPFLLLNGSSGIAVGMATNIPPHNLKEILAACTALVRARMEDSEARIESLSDDELFKIVPGPDFPTGATIMGKSGARDLYTTGNGGIVMRAVTHVEDLLQSAKGNRKRSPGRTAIIVTELPYQVNKSALLEKIAALVNDKQLDGIADLRDESDRDGIRVVLELKRDAVAEVVLNNLYKKTSLQSSFSGNFLALTTVKEQKHDSDLQSAASSAALTPQRFSLRQSLDTFLDFRFETVRRKSAFKMRKVESRAHIVDGLLVALEKVDQVIDLIRSSPDQAHARVALMTSGDADEGVLSLGLSQEQADAVLRLQLGQLTRLNKGKLASEKEDLENQKKELARLLRVDDAVYSTMVEEFDELSSKFGQDRKTHIVSEEGTVNELDMIRNSRSVVVVTRGGYIKRMPLNSFESQNRGTRGKRGTSSSDGTSVEDEVAHCFTCHDHDTLLMITQSGIAFGLRAYQVPTASRTAKGQPIPSVLPIRADQVITTILPVSDFSRDEYVVLATEQGWIKRTPLDAFAKTTSRGLIIASLSDNDRLNWCQICRDGDDILIGSSRGMATRFEVASVRPTARTSRGVKAMKLKEGDTIAAMNVLSGQSEVGKGEKRKEEFVLCLSRRGYGKRVSTSDFRTTGRGGIGLIAIKPKKGQEDDFEMSAFCIVNEDDELLFITKNGIMVRQQASAIPSQSRTATGVMIQKVDERDEISSVSLVPSYEGSDDD